ncbi:MAG: hypothetical protein WB543_00240 [Candidatus Acidiferrum sp.]
MTHPSRKAAGPIFAMLLLLLFGTAAFSSATAQERRVPQTDGVDNTKMGAYRALAQRTYWEFQKGDPAAAAELARVLERVWDKAEDHGGDMALKKTHPDQFDDIDKAMDDFITPLKDYKTKAPEPAKVKAAFNAYLEKLKQAD